MLNHPTLEKLHALRLTGMADAFQEQLSNPLTDLDFESRLGLLIEREYYLRENRRLKRRLSQAKFQQAACIEDVNFSHPRGLNKAAFLELVRGHWVQQHLNLLITGPTGCGKTYLACAIAHKACLTGFTSRYYRLPRLWNELKIAKAGGTYSQWLSQHSKIDLLILDDWGLAPPDDEQRRDLLEILDDRYQQRSTIITSQLPTTHWHEHLNDATIADAILDRLLHNSVRLELTGDSLRKKNNTIAA
ncbi:MAG TPA: IS21-like element helper ATPase IstB [Gammaproteobacteria bacterium]|nr:IS21-like element helper ATPase IstB [Gammaproteobacteria bacterium]